MKIFVCVFLGLMVCACLVQVQAGLSDLFGGHKDDDEDDDHKRGSHYEGGIGKQVIHTLVDGATDRLVDMGEQKFDNPLMDAAIVGIGHKLKNKVHDKINDFGEDDKESEERNDDEDDEDHRRSRKHHDDEYDEDHRRSRKHHDDEEDSDHEEREHNYDNDDVDADRRERHDGDNDGEHEYRRRDDNDEERNDEDRGTRRHDDDEDGGEKKKGNFLTNLFRRKRNITAEVIKSAAIAGATTAGKHVMKNALGLGEKTPTDGKQSGGGIVSKVVDNAKSLVGASSDKKDD